MPGKSILKSSQDDTGDHTDNHEIPNDSVTGDAGGLTPDVTETFSSAYVSVHGVYCFVHDLRSARNGQTLTVGALL
jgi:hypothetical protein